MTEQATVEPLPESPLSLQARDLGLHDSGRWVWRHLSLTVDPGERVALRGPSGSGKTALLLTLAGLIPATEGSVRLGGRPMAQWWMPDYRSRVGYLAQRPALDEADSVDALVSAPFLYRVRSRQAYPREKIEAWLHVLGRDPGFLARRPETLSGGEQQVAALLRLLATNPRVLLLDEPTAAMDADLAGAVQNLLARWQALDSDRSWLWVSHSAGQVSAVADRVVELP